MIVGLTEEQSTTGSAKERSSGENSPTAQYISNEIEIVQTKYRIQKLMMRLGAEALASALQTNQSAVSAMLHDRARIPRSIASRASQLFYQNV